MFNIQNCKKLKVCYLNLEYHPVLLYSDKNYNST